MSETVLTESNFEKEVKKSDIPVLVDFWAPWCGPCKMIASTVSALAESYAGRVKVCKLNTDENPAIAEEYGISAIPTLKIFKAGVVVDEVVGLSPKDVIEKKLDAVI